ncbi:MAG TPA: periplasmic heavy metal sensor [Thermoanaerobaculia bacterium]|jgi:Spy/CpxP family protein refolding chaperone
MKSKTLSGTLVALLFSFLALADSSSAPADDPFARYLYPPDRVMAHAMELGLDDAQKTSIKSEVQKAQGKFVDLQFELQGESEKMVRLLQQKPVDEAGVLAEVDRILALEKDIKKTQISLLVRIKNVLTAAQQEKLSEASR